MREGLPLPLCLLLCTEAKDDVVTRFAHVVCARLGAGAPMLEQVVNRGVRIAYACSH